MVTAKTIDALLPQTQCGECGFPGCMPYAEALAIGGAPIDRCPPGGTITIKALGCLLNIDPTPFLTSAPNRAPAQAVIRESECIGCTKCIQACPVDAIIGSGTLMHTILPDECTGCGLCVEPCPVDCIDMILQPSLVYDKEKARLRHHEKVVRLLHRDQEKQKDYREKKRLTAMTEDKTNIQHYILQAIARREVKKKGTDE
ncbi:MAG: RnfABCDGE type electron transport complex subunit B [Legionellales bacterium]|nr:RnfABCDGE type electron transport complex subunit B [Legionellales bacterium]